MLHEILVSLSGHPSPLWDQIKTTSQQHQNGSLADYVSPPEHAMLAILGHLSDLHLRLKDHTKQIFSSHSSVICRAVASSISAQHLAQFRKKVIDVETSILSNDAAYVGGYGIVPLSTIVGEFSPWTRRLEWLWKVARFILPVDEQADRRAKCTGAMLIDFLEKETYTGYSDLEDMANALLVVAQSSWMRQVSTWILYGNTPAYGGEDFFVQVDPKRVQPHEAASGSGALARELLPHSVSLTTAESILSIGNSLNHIRSHSQHSSTSASIASSDPAFELLPTHLQHLQSLTYPLSSASFDVAIASIRLSISQNVLSNLLPIHEVTEVLDVLHEYLLLGRGEFAVSLIAQADMRIASHNTTQAYLRPIRKAGRLDDMTMKDAELAAVLQQTFSELASLQGDEDLQDDIFELANNLLRLACLPHAEVENTISTILPIPSALTISIPSASPLHLFLSPIDIHTYSSITNYLLSIRRAQTHLASLWKLTPLRRNHPTPLGPPMSATRAGASSLAVRRGRENARATQMRKHWATGGKALFVLNELGAYFQGEVVGRQWGGFRDWVDLLAGLKPTSRPGSSKKNLLKTSQTSQASSVLRTSALDSEGPQNSSDPATLAQGHRACLAAMRSRLLLDDRDFVGGLRQLLTIIDHFIALFARLQSVWQGLDLQEDEGVVDALTNYKKDEGEVWWEMERSGKVVEDRVRSVVELIRDRGRKGGETGGDWEEETVSGLRDMGIADERGRYVPWKGRTIERLIMKLEFLAGGQVIGDGKGGGPDYDDN